MKKLSITLNFKFVIFQIEKGAKPHKRKTQKLSDLTRLD